MNALRPVRRLLAEYDAEFGQGAARRDLARGAAVWVLAALNVLGAAILLGGGA